MKTIIFILIVLLLYILRFKREGFSNIPDKKKYLTRYEYINPKYKNKDITITVALPGLNCEKIIWLALESLKRQTNLDNIYWELICIEEYGYSRKIIKNYLNLPNCKRIVHIGIDPIKYGIKRGKKKGVFPLINKWIHISRLSDPNSKIFVLHAVDCYSSPKRLYIHNEHFKNSNCIFSSQPNYRKKDQLYANTHLNMALRTNHMKQYVSNKTSHFNKAIDGHIIKCILKNLKQDKLTEKTHFFDSTIDKDNWWYSLDTDGYNNISVHRQKVYNSKKKSDIWQNRSEIKNHYQSINKYIPRKIFMKLLSLQ